MHTHTHTLTPTDTQYGAVEKNNTVQGSIRFKFRFKFSLEPSISINKTEGSHNQGYVPFWLQMSSVGQSVEKSFKWLSTFFFFYKVEAVLYENDLDSLESPEAWREPGAPGPPSPIAIPAWCWVAAASFTPECSCCEPQTSPLPYVRTPPAALLFQQPPAWLWGECASLRLRMFCFPAVGFGQTEIYWER